MQAEKQPVKEEKQKNIVSPEKSILDEKVAEAQKNMIKVNAGMEGVPGNYALQSEYATIAAAANLRSAQKKKTNLKVDDEIFNKKLETILKGKSFEHMMKNSNPETLYKAATTGNGGLIYEELKNAMKARKAEESQLNNNNNRQPVVNNHKEKTIER